MTIKVLEVKNSNIIIENVSLSMKILDHPTDSNGSNENSESNDSNSNGGSDGNTDWNDNN